MSCRGLHLAINVSSVPGSAPSLTFTIQGKDPASGAYYTILASAAITATGTTVLKVYPGLTPVANGVADDVLPEVWRVDVAAGNGNAAVYSVGALLVV